MYFKVLHGRLATKNVMVFARDDKEDSVVVKLTEFSYACDRSSSSNLIDDCLAVRWSAPEVLKRRKYGEASDVWSFGVLLWEIFTLATVPYYELTLNTQVVEAVTSGQTLTFPEGCPQSIYDDLMHPCWIMVAANRPTFTQLELAIQMQQHLCEERRRQELMRSDRIVSV